VAIPPTPVPDNGDGSPSLNDVRFGILIMVLAMLILPGIDAIAKHLSSGVPPAQVAWGRFFFQAIFLFPFAAMSGGFRIGRNLWKHAARGILIAVATVLFFSALERMPLADTIAIFFVEPLILTLLAPVFLKEKVGWRRFSAVAVGLAGSLIIIQPSFEVFGAVSLLPLGAATAFAFYIILTRSLTLDTGVMQMQFYVGIFGCGALSLALWLGEATGTDFLTPVWPSLEDWLWLAALAAIATTGHLLIVQSVRRIGASMIAPFQYLEIVSATSLGYIFFDDFPGSEVWIGIAVIISSGLYVFYREQKRASAEF